MSIRTIRQGVTSEPIISNDDRLDAFRESDNSTNSKPTNKDNGDTGRNWWSAKAMMKPVNGEPIGDDRAHDMSELRHSANSKPPNKENAIRAFRRFGKA